MTFPPVLRRGLLATFAGASVALIIRAWAGPYWLVRSPMNAEAICALAALLLWWSGKFSRSDPGSEMKIRTPVCMLILAGIVAAAFWPSLGFPLTFDDYAHLSTVRNAGRSFWLDQLTIPALDNFLRPLGMYDYRLEAVAAGQNAFLWRLGNVVWHVANCVLLFFFSRQLSLNTGAALFAAILFGVHASRPESAGWVAARFDLLATFFLLSSFLMFYRYADNARETGRWVWFAGGLISGVAGLLAKEAAYVWPLLITLLFWRRLPARALAIPYFLTGAVFAYRWRLLAGIGGYQTGEQPDIFVFSAVRTAKALFLRIWAVLWFPINWSEVPGVAIALVMAAMLLGAGLLSWNRMQIHWRALAFVFIAALPVQHMLLIGQDLEKSRVLYLPSAGFAILLGFALQSAENRRIAICTGIAILLFQAAVLQHNFAIWGRVADAGRKACIEAGELAKQEPSRLIVANLPRLRDGVYLLGNGFPQCVEWHTGVAANRIGVELSGSEIPPGLPLFRWDESIDHFVRVR